MGGDSGDPAVVLEPSRRCHIYFAADDYDFGVKHFREAQGGPVPPGLPERDGAWLRGWRRHMSMFDAPGWGKP